VLASVYVVVEASAGLVSAYRTGTPFWAVRAAGGRVLEWRGADDEDGDVVFAARSGFDEEFVAVVVDEHGGVEITGDVEEPVGGGVGVFVAVFDEPIGVEDDDVALSEWCFGGGPVGLGDTEGGWRGA
jgi:predicted NUDIX family NTP pyrophosphohydrolase